MDKYKIATFILLVISIALLISLIQTKKNDVLKLSKEEEKETLEATVQKDCQTWQYTEQKEHPMVTFIKIREQDTEGRPPQFWAGSLKDLMSLALGKLDAAGEKYYAKITVKDDCNQFVWQEFDVEP